MTISSPVAATSVTNPRRVAFTSDIGMVRMVTVPSLKRTVEMLT
jgi:hypothetical protein